MKSIITVTRKGQTTLPAPLRRKLGLGVAGGKLHIRFNDQANELIVSRVATIEEISERLSRSIKPGTKPLLDVHEYYERHRANEYKEKFKR